MKYKKLIVSILLILVSILTIFILIPKKTVLFFIPHQDDEILTFSPAIQQYISKGYDVHVVLATDGISSSVRSNILNGENICPIHNEKHDFNISENKFTQLRDEEYKKALKSLGVKKHNIHISRFSAKDGELSKERAKTIILEYIEKYPKAKVMTFSDLAEGLPSSHNDHYTLGKAAKELYSQNKISELELFVEFYVYDEFIDKYNNINIEKYNPTNKRKIKKATKAYTEYNPKKNEYAIGYHSVNYLFEELYKKLNNNKFVSLYYKAKK